MQGKIDFNGELAGAEHLVCEDEFCSTDIRTRQAFGAAIKNIAVNKIQSVHFKNRTAVNIDPFWRLSISLNDDDEALRVLPPLEDHVADKLILLSAQRNPMPMPTSTPDEKEAFWAAIEGEIPAFISSLIQFKRPDRLGDNRYGVQSYHNENLLEKMHGISPEAEFFELVETLEPWGLDPTWEGTAEELKRLLLADPRTNRTAGDRLRYTNTAGTILGRLAKKHPGRIIKNRSGSSRGWVIHEKDQARFDGCDQ